MEKAIKFGAYPLSNSMASYPSLQIGLALPGGAFWLRELADLSEDGPERGLFETHPGTGDRIQRFIIYAESSPRLSSPHPGFYRAHPSPCEIWGSPRYALHIWWNHQIWRVDDRFTLLYSSPSFI